MKREKRYWGSLIWTISNALRSYGNTAMAMFPAVVHRKNAENGD